MPRQTPNEGVDPAIEESIEEGYEGLTTRLELDSDIRRIIESKGELMGETRDLTRDGIDHA